MKKSFLGLNVVLVALSFNLVGCDVLMSQNPLDSFVSKKFPKQLEWFRSQLREIPSAKQEQIVARVKRDQKRNDLLKVAVIDSGVDVAHADLLNQIDYRIENDRIVGAGYDIMGNGNFGSHVLVNPTLYAFGAEGLRGGRIHNPPEDPLKELKIMNDRFKSIVLEGIQKDPALKGSLFGKMTADSFTVFGFDDIRLKYEEQLREYKEAVEGKFVINENTKPKTSREASRLEDNKTAWHVMNIEHHPVAYSNYIEHADLFIKLVKDAYNILDAENGFTKKLAVYSEYMNFMMAKKDFIDIKNIESPEGLKKALEFVLYGSDLHDPIRTFKRQFSANREYRELSFEQAMRKYYAAKEAMLQSLLANPDVRSEDRKELEKNKDSLIALRNSIENLIALEKNPAAYEEMRSDLHRYVFRTKHPYLANESNGNSHGTHVSGVIAKQNPNVRILPVRVTTQSVQVSKERQKEVVDAVLAKFEIFMKSPYFAPLKAAISAEYGGLKMTDGSIESQVKKYLVANPLNGVFILDILLAVEKAGLEKAKIANVSLGTTFKKSHSLSQKTASMAEDIFSEFARHEIGQTIQQKARGTLFMIATGNDGGWIDGVSKTGFPVGITSLRMIKIAKDAKLAPSPNNSIKNVLAVGSINPNGTLTPFTNILIDPNIPQIFSTGEEIKSSVPAKSLGLTNAMYQKRMGKTAKLLSKMDVIASKLDEKLPVMERFDKMNKLQFYSEITANFSISLPTLVHIADPIGRESMSGTSMATPTVTGLIADYIIDKAQKMKIPLDSIYDDARFSPETLSKEILELALEKSMTPMFTVRMLTEGIKTFKNSENVRRQDEAMKSLVSPIRPPITSKQCRAMFR